ncbi:FRG domain-containing protein [Candidatus Stoquefichus massiliensis]|uniref:FRG domain-containing protein n=1 Tax=Candidatus Stoquefichus massiliensis TaxID=1470350 RepID=UPI000486F7D9|nr:FRG domain-containing protein [Candidatus Stoquefichus massiliensis]
MDIFGYLGKIGECIDRLEKKYYEHYKNKILIAFRGEPRNFEDTKLMPSMFRENEYIYKENYLFDLFCDLGLIKDSDKWIDKATDTQHYAALSRMLDITFDCLVALYFACKDRDSSDKDGYLYVFGFPEYYSPHSGFIEQLYENVLNVNENIMFQKNFLVFSENYANERIKAQKGGFIFFPSQVFTPLDEVYYNFVKINASDKEKIIDDLDKVFKINEAILFPEKDKIARYARNKFIENEYKIKQFSVQDEMENRIQQVKYEMTMSTHLSSIDKLRRIRKDKDELIQYIMKQYNLTDVDRMRLLKELDYKFKLLNGYFGGR